MRIHEELKEAVEKSLCMGKANLRYESHKKCIWYYFWKCQKEDYCDVYKEQIGGIMKDKAR